MPTGRPFILIWVFQITSVKGIEKNIPFVSQSYTSNTTNNNSNVTSFGHSLSRDFSVTIAAIFLVIIMIAIITNVFLIMTILTARKLHSFTYLLIVNMATSDLLTAIGVIPFDVEYMLLGYFQHGRLACGIVHTMFLISLPSSVLSLVLLTLERFLSVVFPVKEFLTRKRITLCIMGMWCYTVTVAIFPIMFGQADAVLVEHGICYLKFPLGYQIFQLISNFLIPVIVIFGMYMKLFMVSYKQANKTAWLTLKLGRLSTLRRRNSGEAPRKRTLSMEYPETKNVKVSLSLLSSLARNMKAFKRIGLLLGVFLVCWLVYIIIVASNYTCLCHPRELTWVANVINYSTAAVNPILYGVLDKAVRREFVNVLGRMKKSCIYDFCYFRVKL